MPTRLNPYIVIDAELSPRQVEALIQACEGYYSHRPAADGEAEERKHFLKEAKKLAPGLSAKYAGWIGEYVEAEDEQQQWVEWMRTEMQSKQELCPEMRRFIRKMEKAKNPRVGKGKTLRAQSKQPEKKVPSDVAFSKKDERALLFAEKNRRIGREKRKKFLGGLYLKILKVYFPQKHEEISRRLPSKDDRQAGQS